jgi:hypothetical protein
VITWIASVGKPRFRNSATVTDVRNGIVEAFESLATQIQGRDRCDRVTVHQSSYCHQMNWAPSGALFLLAYQVHEHAHLSESILLYCLSSRAARERIFGRLAPEIRGGPLLDNTALGTRQPAGARNHLPPYLVSRASDRVPETPRDKRGRGSEISPMWPNPGDSRWRPSLSGDSTVRTDTRRTKENKFGFRLL